MFATYPGGIYSAGQILTDYANAVQCCRWSMDMSYFYQLQRVDANTLFTLSIVGSVTPPGGLVATTVVKPVFHSKYVEPLTGIFGKISIGNEPYDPKIHAPPSHYESKPIKKVEMVHFQEIHGPKDGCVIL